MSFEPLAVQLRVKLRATGVVEQRRIALRPLDLGMRKLVVAKWGPLLRSEGPTAKWPDAEWDYARLLEEAHWISDNPRGAVWLDEQSSRTPLGIVVVSGPVAFPLPLRGTPSDLRGVWLENVAIAPQLRPACPLQQRLEYDVPRFGQIMTKWAIEQSVDAGCGAIALHADGDKAAQKYGPRTREFPTAWGMAPIGPVAHRLGEKYAAFVGDSEWAHRFVSSLEDALRMEANP